MVPFYLPKRKEAVMDCCSTKPPDGKPVPMVTFGMALDAIKCGKRAARTGWNGKGMFIYLNRGSTDRSMIAQRNYDGVPEELFDTGDVGTSTRLPNINMKSATGCTVTGWLASQTDMFAHDWQIID
jgi:hypothetical protein